MRLAWATDIHLDMAGNLLEDFKVLQHCDKHWLKIFDILLILKKRQLKYLQSTFYI